MAVLGFRPASKFWHRAERGIVFAFVAATFALLVLALLRLLADMIATKHGFGSLELLESAANIWIINIMIFTLLYWQIDRGGPEARAFRHHRPPDFVFGESEGEKAGEQLRRLPFPGVRNLDVVHAPRLLETIEPACEVICYDPSIRFAPDPRARGLPGGGHALLAQRGVPGPAFG
jgi:hypothetical protein